MKCAHFFRIFKQNAVAAAAAAPYPGQYATTGYEAYPYSSAAAAAAAGKLTPNKYGRIFDLGFIS